MESHRVRLMRLDHHHYQQYHVDQERSIRKVNRKTTRQEDCCQLIFTKRLNIDN